MDGSSREDADELIEDDYSSNPESQTAPDASAPIFATYVEPSTSGMPGIESIAKLEPSLFPSSAIPAGSRIALTQDPSNEGQYLWTFVPRAKGPGVEPNIWPQNVNILGQEYLATQDEWDLYKCNPDYECVIPLFPGIPTVSRRPGPSSSRPTTGNRASSPLKRGASEASSDSQESTHQSRHKRRKTASFQVESDNSDVQEVPLAQAEANRAKLRRKKEKEARANSRTRSASFRMWSMANDLPSVSEGGSAADTAPSPSKLPPKGERVSMDTDPVQTKRSRHVWEQDPAYRSSKRAKTSQSVEEEAEKEYLRTGRARRMKTTASRPGRGAPPPKAKAKERDFWQDVNFSQFKGKKFVVEPEADANGQPSIKVEEMPQQSSTADSSARRSPSIFVDSGDDDEYEIPSAGAWDDTWNNLQDSDEERERRLAESRRKMEELNNLERLRQEEVRRQRQRAEQRLAEERARRQKAEEEERRKKAEKENRRRDGPWGPSWHQTNAPWSETFRSTNASRAGGINFEWFNDTRHNPFGSRGSTFQSYRPPPASTASSNTWTSQKALDRYNRLSEAFDAFKATPSVPLPAEDQIPWPVLGPKYDLNQINWKSVEKFFEEAEKIMGGRGTGKEKWKEFLKTSTRRFHPDRWRARGLIGDKGFGIDVEEVVNHVSKVLTPLYRNVN